MLWNISATHSPPPPHSILPSSLVHDLSWLGETVANSLVGKLFKENAKRVSKCRIYINKWNAKPKLKIMKCSRRQGGVTGDSGRQKLSTNLYIQNVLACYATWPTVSRGSSNEEELKQQLETRRNFKYKFNSHILCVTEMQRQQRQAAYAGKAQNKQHKLFRQATEPRQREREAGRKMEESSKFSCSEHISSEATVGAGNVVANWRCKSCIYAAFM